MSYFSKSTQGANVSYLRLSDFRFDIPVFLAFILFWHLAGQDCLGNKLNIVRQCTCKLHPVSLKLALEFFGTFISLILKSMKENLTSTNSLVTHTFASIVCLKRYKNGK